MGRVFRRKQFTNYLGENRGILDIDTSFIADPSPSPTPTPSPTQVSPTPTPTNTPTPTPTNPFNMNIGNGFDRQTNSVIFDSNGDYYVAGTQWNYDLNYSRGFTKVLNDGTFDSSFTCNIDADTSRTGYNLTLDNKDDLIVYGSFLTINGTSRQYIGKVDSYTGALDTSWTPTVAAQSVYDMFVDSNNDYWLWGSFTTVRDSGSAVSITRNRIMKMDEDGIIYTNIFTGTGFNGIVQDVAFDGLGGMYCVGNFTTYNGVACNRIVKLDIITGDIDPSFVYGSGFNTGMYSVVYDPDGYIFVCGGAVTYDGTTTNKKLFKIRVDGILDGTFVPTLTPGGVPTHTKVVLDTTNNCVYTSMYYISSNLYKFDRYTGTQDVSFTKQMQIWYNNSGGYKNFLLQPNGKIITVGNMTLYNNTNYNFIVRINPDGSSNTVAN